MTRETTEAPHTTTQPQPRSAPGLVIWLTGLSGAGKTTLADAVEKLLFEHGHRSIILDGDVLRQGLCKDLGYGAADRHENVRRAGAVAGLMAEAGLLCIVALISPFRADRSAARAVAPAGRFIEVFVNAPLAVCEQRDVKGLYRRARANQIPDFTGISSPYEEPEAPELTVRTAELSVEACASIIVSETERRLRA